MNLSNLKIGQKIRFGRYDRSENAPGVDITWVKVSPAHFMSEYAVASIPYDIGNTATTTYDNSFIKSWLMSTEMHEFSRYQRYLGLLSKMSDEEIEMIGCISLPSESNIMNGSEAQFPYFKRHGKRVQFKGTYVSYGTMPFRETDTGRRCRVLERNGDVRYTWMSSTMDVRPVLEFADDYEVKVIGGENPIFEVIPGAKTVDCIEVPEDMLLAFYGM